MLSSDVDLTQNHQFSEHGLSNLQRIVQRKLKVKPWDVRTYRLEKSVDPSTELILTGNAEDRATKKWYLEYINETSCERCGRELKIPWNKVGCLCKQCSDDLDAEFRQGDLKNKLLKTKENVVTTRMIASDVVLNQLRPL